MKRTQLYLDEAIWRDLHARARSECTTISGLVRQAVQAQYFSNSEGRAKAIRAFVGIRKQTAHEPAAVEIVGGLRRGSRLVRLSQGERHS